MKQLTFILSGFLLITNCKQVKNETELSNIIETRINPSVKETLAKLKTDGFETFDYVDEAIGDTIIMQKYFIAFLKRGPNRNQSEEEAVKLQEAHQAHLGKMYDLGYADISGPFGDDGDI